MCPGRAAMAVPCVVDLSSTGSERTAFRLLGEWRASSSSICARFRGGRVGEVLNDIYGKFEWVCEDGGLTFNFVDSLDLASGPDEYPVLEDG